MKKVICIKTNLKSNLVRGEFRKLRKLGLSDLSALDYTILYYTSKETPGSMKA